MPEFPSVSQLHRELKVCDAAKLDPGHKDAVLLESAQAYGQWIDLAERNYPARIRDVLRLMELLREYPPGHLPGCGWHQRISYLNEMGFERGRHGDCTCGLTASLAEMGIKP